MFGSNLMEVNGKMELRFLLVAMHGYDKDPCTALWRPQ